MLCQLITSNISIKSGQEIILSWKSQSTSKHHTKPEYIKILQDKSYTINYSIQWKSISNTSQPLCLTIYKVTKDYFLETLNRHVTVCVGSPIVVNKNFPYALKNNERICIGAKNFSIIDFQLLDCKFSIS